MSRKEKRAKFARMVADERRRIKVTRVAAVIADLIRLGKATSGALSVVAKHYQLPQGTVTALAVKLKKKLAELSKPASSNPSDSKESTALAPEEDR